MPSKKKLYCTCIDSFERASLYCQLNEADPLTNYDPQILEVSTKANSFILAQTVFNLMYDDDKGEIDLQKIGM
jgi:hypothetical protein